MKSAIFAGQLWSFRRILLDSHELEHNQDFQALSTLIKSLETNFSPWGAVLSN